MGQRAALPQAPPPVDPGPARAFARAAHAGSPEAERAATEAAGDSAKPNDTGSEHHEGPGAEAGEEQEDPSKHFNFIGMKPGHLFDYSGKDELGGRFGDGQMTDPETGRQIHEEEPASPPFIFMDLAAGLGIGHL